MADHENNEAKREISLDKPEIPEAKFSPDAPQLTPAMENLWKEGAKALAIDWTKVDNWSRVTLAVFFSIQKNTKTSGIISKDDFYASLRSQTDKFLDSTHFQGDREAFYQSVIDSSKQEKDAEIALRKDNGEAGRDKTKSGEVEKIMGSGPNLQEKKI